MKSFYYCNNLRVHIPFTLSSWFQDRRNKLQSINIVCVTLVMMLLLFKIITELYLILIEKNSVQRKI